MFGSKRTTAASSIVSSEQVETIVGRDTVFKGSISSNSSIRVDGQVEGEITTTGDVIIGQSGNAKVQVTARNATIAGSVTGNLNITEKLELAASATVQGDIKVGILVVGEGAVFKGSCEMRRDGEPAPKEGKQKS